MDERHNAPEFCDLAQVYGMDFDCLHFDQVLERLDPAKAEGGWLVLVGHDVGRGGRQTVLEETLEELCRYACDSAHGIWVDTVAAVANYIASQGKSNA